MIICTVHVPEQLTFLLATIIKSPPEDGAGLKSAYSTYILAGPQH
jgi:hypothetical protein